jgi:putative membrane protein insertion efficiency factor
MHNIAAAASGIAGAFLRGSIRIYQSIASPLLPASCRYWPSCSEYAAQAIAAHGPAAGGILALKRIGRCHPWGDWGYDPVPGRAATISCEHHKFVRISNTAPVSSPTSGSPT